MPHGHPELVVPHAGLAGSYHLHANSDELTTDPRGVPAQCRTDHSVKAWLRLLSKSEVRDNGCWHWLAAGDTYGETKLRGKRIGAHRMAWTLACCDPLGYDVRHQCGNRRCVNPTHLYLQERKAWARPPGRTKQG